MSDEYYESKQLARCFLTKISPAIKIPENIFKSLEPLGKNLVAILPGESKKMTFFLTNCSQVLFVRLFLNKDKLDDSFFTSLREKLKELGINNLFSTGICFKAEVCVWEAVFEFDDKGKLPQIQEKLEKVMNVKKTKFEVIKVSD
jgi:hypothetical protein